MSVDHSTSRRAGAKLIRTQAQRQVQTFFDELKNGTQNYRTIASLGLQIAQAYRGRCILELLQNAHDALANARPDDPRQISFVLRTFPKPVLLIGNSGHPFQPKDFKGLCQLGQSPKDPNESIGNKGLGFRSVLEVSTAPEIWSTAPAGCDMSFVFRFDPSVSDRIAAAAQEMEEMGLETRSPFDPERPLLDWSQAQLDQYCQRLLDAHLSGASEAREFLSPYLIPLVIDGDLPEVDRLLTNKHVTVVRLPLDGGRAGACDEAIQSVKDQLQSIDARSMVFLPHLKTLIIDIDNERRTLARKIKSDVEFSDCPQTRQQRLFIGHSGTATNDHTTHQFQVWMRTIGGDNDPEQADRIRDIVEHLPNRWPEVRRVTVGVAVEKASTSNKGLFVIFLPTEMATGTGAHVNAPFYGSLNRRQINLQHPYNKFLIETVLDLTLDAVTDLTSRQPEGWRAQAVIDLLASTATVGEQDWCFMDKLHQRALERGNALRDQALILCHGGWCVPRKIRAMPKVPDDATIGIDHWRKCAAFAIVSTALDGRQSAAKTLIEKLDGSLSPTNSEWVQMIERMATSVQNREIDVTWDAFLDNLMAVLPEKLRSEPRNRTQDPLADARFLPDQDRRLISASDPAKLFFQPVRGIDDAADLVGDVPDSLKQRVAFLHPSVQTQHGSKPRKTRVHKFLDGRFARGFRRAEILQDVVLNALPSLPIPHGGSDVRLCSELLKWTLELVGQDPSDELLPLLRRLPVPCHGGWHAMGDAVFGPGWPGRLGEDLWSLAQELPEDAATRLRKTALLPPDDPRWGIAATNLDRLFSRVGVVNGLRLYPGPKIPFRMSEYNYSLPTDAPAGTPQEAWEAWRKAVRKEARPAYDSWFDYSLSEIQLLPEIHYLKALSQPGRSALSRLILASFENWPYDWDSVTIRKLKGHSWSHRITSPLKYWLMTMEWLDDGHIAKPLNRRWFVPASLLSNQRARFRHLYPLTRNLARRLEDQQKLKVFLTHLGMNVYPMEQDRTGPELLQALAASWTHNRIPSERFDVFLGQVRHAWDHLDPDKELPDALLIRTGRRTFSVRGRDQLADVYLPDHRERAQSLREHGKHILEMLPAAANRTAQRLLLATDIKQASTLQKRFFVDDTLWTNVIEGIQPLDETKYAWLPETLLTIAAHRTGTAAKSWLNSVNKLRRAHTIECETLVVQLVDGDNVVAESKPEAQWLPGDVLAIRRDVNIEQSHESLASAAQDILDRQDILKDLRLVLGYLSGQENPTLEQIEAALERAEIDAQTFADIRNHWAGSITLTVDRIRPVLALLEISDDGLDLAATDINSLTQWLSSNLSQWSIPELLSAARRSRDDHAMGVAVWHTLGDIAQLPAWNAALAKLGDRYNAVENHAIDVQAAEHVEAATPLLRGLARYVAIEAGDPNLFHKIEAVNRNFEAYDTWSMQWWEVPFSAVIGALHSRYAGVPCAEHYLEVLEEATTVDDLRTAFHERGIATDPDPYEIARRNKDRFDGMLTDLHDLHGVWVELNNIAPIALAPPEPPAKLDPGAYLRLWSDADMLERCLRIIKDSEFATRCNGCTSLNDIRNRLGLDSDAVETQRRERREQEQEAERQRRTFDVAGVPFELGTKRFDKLFEHLNSLADPVGPRASQDTFTSLAIPPRTGRSSGGSSRGGRTSHLRPPPGLPELVGIVGEIHAYRFLRQEFGNDAVTPDTWVSEIRLKALPLVTGEPNNTSDGLGFDFRFSHRRRRWPRRSQVDPRR